jgi:glycosyltransferase involved in cell wall biosynthesis
MRIGMIYDTQFHHDPRVKNEAISLIKEGNEVVLFSLNYDNLPTEEVIDGITFVRYPSNKLEYKLSAIAYDFPLYHWLMSRKIKDFIRSYQVQALHVHDMVIAEAVVRANASFGLPVILDLHENRPEIMKSYKHLNSTIGKWLINLNRWKKNYYRLAATVDKIVVVTPSAKADIVAVTNKQPDDICVVPNTSKLDEFHAFKDFPEIKEKMQGYFNIIYMGETSLRRGTDTAIEAVALLKNKIPQIKLWLIGRSSYDGELKAMVKSRSLEKFVSFEGWKEMAFFPTYFSNSQICLSPLKRNLHHDTTFANKLFQYMGAGTPLIVSNCTEQAELVRNEKCGLVHNADDPVDLADKIYSLYNDPDRARAMGINGKMAVESVWNWDKTIVSLLEMYRELSTHIKSK